MGMIADYASFRKMISTTVIQIIFWVVVTGLIILGLISFGSGIYDSLKGSYTAKWNGVPYWVLIPVFAGIGIFIWRVFCEAAIVVFRINEGGSGQPVLVVTRARVNSGESKPATVNNTDSRNADEALRREVVRIKTTLGYGLTFYPLLIA